MSKLFGRYAATFLCGSAAGRNAFGPVFNEDTIDFELAKENARGCLLEPLAEKNIFTIGAGLLRGIVKIIYPEVYEGLKNFGGYGVAEDGSLIVDYWGGSASDWKEATSSYEESMDVTIPDNRHTLFRLKDGKLEAVCIDTDGTRTPFLIKMSGADDGKKVHSPSALISLLLAYFLTKDNTSRYGRAVTEHYRDMEKHIRDNDQTSATWQMDMLANDLYAIACKDTSDLYRQFGPLGIDGVPAENVFINNYGVFDPQEVKVKTFVGDSPYFKVEKETVTKKIKIKTEKITKKVSDLIKSKKYDLGIDWKVGKELIPTDCEGIVLSDEAFRTLSAITTTHNTDMPFWNICWYGPSGTGKSTDARALAQTLGFPYYPQALSDASYADDILVSKTANTSQLTKEEFLEEIAKYPSVSEATKDLESAWEKLTGERKEATIEQYEKALNEKIYSLSNDIRPFKEVPSPLFMAFVNGGVCELVEANAIKPAQAKVLNSMLDDTAKIYIDGKVYHRNPNFVLISTFNCDEGTEGVHALSNDFVQRFHYGEFFKEITDAAIKQRIMRKTALKDADMISKMIKVYRAMQRVCTEEGDNHDFVGLRQVYAWAHLTAITKKPYQSALSTMVSLGTFSEEFAEELKQALHTQFSEADDNNEEE